MAAHKILVKLTLGPISSNLSAHRKAQIFFLQIFGSASVKAEGKHIDEIDPWSVNLSLKIPVTLTLSDLKLDAITFKEVDVNQFWKRQQQFDL